MEQDALSTTELARNRLTPRELKALVKYETSRDRTPIGLDIALSMYDLYLNGHSYEEIQRVNKKAGQTFTLGQIINAGITYEWDERRVSHQAALFDSVALKVKQTQMESVSFVTDLLAAAHKQHGDRLKQFLQSGNESDLGELAIHSLKGYQDAVGMLMKVTGQDKPDPKSGGTQVNIINPGSAEVKTTETGPKRLKSEDFFKLLQLVDNTVDGVVE